MKDLNRKKFNKSVLKNTHHNSIELIDWTDNRIHFILQIVNIDQFHSAYVNSWSIVLISKRLKFFLNFVLIYTITAWVDWKKMSENSKRK